MFNRENKNFYPLEIQSVSLIRISNIGGKEEKITRAERLPLLGNWFASLCNLCFSFPLTRFGIHIFLQRSQLIFFTVDSMLMSVGRTWWQEGDDMLIIVFKEMCSPLVPPPPTYPSVAIPWLLLSDM